MRESSFSSKDGLGPKIERLESIRRIDLFKEKKTQPVQHP